jgi:DNA-3-methyladenine glycosylase
MPNDQLRSLTRPQLDQLFAGCVDNVAMRLLGLFLFNRTAEGLYGGMIIETEAYCENDRAAHCHPLAHRNRKSGPMKLPGGHIYRHWSRGWCLNLTSGSAQKRFGSAVLIRALLPDAASRSSIAAAQSNGPVKLTKYLRLDPDPRLPTWNEQPIWNSSLELYIADTRSENISCGKRVGIDPRHEEAIWPRNYVIDEPGIFPFLSPGAKRDKTREKCPPNFLARLKREGILKNCVMHDGCDAAEKSTD